MIPLKSEWQSIGQKYRNPNNVFTRELTHRNQEKEWHMKRVDSTLQRMQEECTDTWVTTPRVTHSASTRRPPQHPFPPLPSKEFLLTSPGMLTCHSLSSFSTQKRTRKLSDEERIHKDNQKQKALLEKKLQNKLIEDLLLNSLITSRKKMIEAANKKKSKSPVLAPNKSVLQIKTNESDKTTAPSYSQGERLSRPSHRISVPWGGDQSHLLIVSNINSQIGNRGRKSSITAAH